MVALVSGLFGLGLWLLFDAATRGRAPRPAAATVRVRAERRLTEFMAVAGVRGVTVSLRNFALFSLGWGVATGVAAQALFGWPVVSLALAGLGATGPGLYYTLRHDRRRAVVQAALIDAIAQLRDAIRAGHSVRAALATLAIDGPEALREGFDRLARAADLGGFAGTVTAWQRELADPIADQLAVTLRVTDRTGPDVISKVLDELAGSAREELLTQGALRARRASTVLQGRVIALLPFAMLLGIRAVNPAYVEPFSRGQGQVVLAACALMVAGGYRWMMRLTRLSGDERVLGS